MKNLLLSLCLIGMFAFYSISQETPKFDVVLKLDGTEMVGNIQAISSDHIDFNYQNETLKYVVNKSDILKVTFASGRVEFFNKAPEKTENKSNLEDHHNKVAVLPFGFIKDGQLLSDQTSTQVQKEAHALFVKFNVFMTYQDPTTTNALLIKAGVDNHNIQGYTMGEICGILGVEYVVQGVVNVDKTTVSTYNGSSTTGKVSSQPVTHVGKGGRIIGTTNDTSGSSYTSSSSTTTQNYETNVSMSIYKDNGTNIYSDTHTSFWNTADSYKVTLNYLVKRTPLYKK